MAYKLSPERIETITKAIANGNTHDVAASLGGIAESTFYAWMSRGKEAKKGQYKQFYDKVKKAEAYAEADRVQRIQKAGRDGDWKADAWYLERRYPDKWGRRFISADLNHSGTVVQKHEHEYEIRVQYEQKLKEDPESAELLERLFEREQEVAASTSAGDD